jgi:hypothetical protein
MLPIAAVPVAETNRISPVLETIFSRLLVGDADIAGQFTAAKPFWDEFFIEHGDKPEAELADVLTITQSRFRCLLFRKRPWQRRRDDLGSNAVPWRQLGYPS